ncbi:MAG: hypothetical protein ACREP9_06545 [Candidatus Dormibacteraceae bacterium]
MTGAVRTNPAEGALPYVSSEGGNSVKLYSRDPRIVKSVREWASPVKVILGRINVSDLPRKADLVVTMGQLNKETELFAMRMGAMCLVLPEGGNWLGEHIDRYPLIVGVDLATPGKLAT